jgi:hypothetical protein
MATGGDGKYKEKKTPLEDDESKVKDSHITTDFDIKKIAENFENEDKKVFEAICQLILDLNGAQSDITAGQPKTYIEKKNYVHYVVNDNKDGGKTLSAGQIDIIEQTLNYRALGGGKMGAIGAQLRKELWPYFVKGREAIPYVIKGTTITQELKSDMKEYAEQLSRVNIVSAVIRKNAKSLAAQAGINLFTKLHHWDKNNQKEWTALFAALGLADDFASEDIRPLVYLALHPIPLSVSSFFRKAATGVDQEFELENTITGTKELKISKDGFVNSVVLRSKAIPAGYATFSVCSVAWQNISAESYGARLKEYIKNAGAVTYQEFVELAEDVKANGECYHPMAREFGVRIKSVNMDSVKAYMTIAAAYIMEISKGTLSRSAALVKFIDQNSRVVSLWRTRFKLEKVSERDSVTAFLTATEKKQPTPAARIAAIKDDARVNEIILDYAKDKMKVYDKVKELTDNGHTGLTIKDLLPPSEQNLGLG